MGNILGISLHSGKIELPSEIIFHTLPLSTNDVQERIFLMIRRVHDRNSRNFEFAVLPYLDEKTTRGAKQFEDPAQLEETNSRKQSREIVKCWRHFTGRYVRDVFLARELPQRCNIYRPFHRRWNFQRNWGSIIFLIGRSAYWPGPFFDWNGCFIPAFPFVESP